MTDKVNADSHPAKEMEKIVSLSDLVHYNEGPSGSPKFGLRLSNITIKKKKEKKEIGDIFHTRPNPETHSGPKNWGGLLQCGTKALQKCLEILKGH